MTRRTGSIVALCTMLTAFVLCLQMAPAALEEELSAKPNPCSSLPKECRYTWDPAIQCCNAARWTGCFNACL
jgi:hypothetical protein